MPVKRLNYSRICFGVARLLGRQKGFLPFFQNLGEKSAVVAMFFYLFDFHALYHTLNYETLLFARHCEEGRSDDAAISAKTGLLRFTSFRSQ
jgi:hypothetical protein